MIDYRRIDWVWSLECGRVLITRSTSEIPNLEIDRWYLSYGELNSLPNSQASLSLMNLERERKRRGKREREIAFIGFLWYISLKATALVSSPEASRRSHPFKEWSLKTIWSNTEYHMRLKVADRSEWFINAQINRWHKWLSLEVS